MGNKFLEFHYVSKTYRHNIGHVIKVDSHIWNNYIHVTCKKINGQSI
jgi:hypothetical protein